MERYRCLDLLSVLSVTWSCQQLSPQNLLVVLCCIRVWLFQISPASKNISGFFKYLWLRKISLASSNISGFWKVSPTSSNISSQLRKISPASSNISSFEKYLQLLQISLASKNISSFDYFRIHLISGWELIKKSCPFRVFFVDCNYASVTMRNLTYQVGNIYLTEGRVVIVIGLYAMTCDNQRSSLSVDMIVITW